MIKKESIFFTNQFKKPLISDAEKGFFRFFSRYDCQSVLVVTDEELNSDLRVAAQLTALSQLTDNIDVVYVHNSGVLLDTTQRKKIQKKLNLRLFKNIFLLPKFLWLSHRLQCKDPIYTKAKLGIYLDNLYLLSSKINTKSYSLVICNNLVSIMNIDLNEGTQYIYDIHEFEVFRNRNKNSLIRSFFLFLNEKSVFNNTRIAFSGISRCQYNYLKYLYKLKDIKFEVIYNQNFLIEELETDNKTQKEKVQLIYIGNINLDRGINDIVKLSYQHDILVVACAFKQEALDKLINESRLGSVKIFKGMDYHDFLVKSIEKYKINLFLILLNPTNISYRLALPNKLFQAMALNLPIIAYKGTYLADIIKKYHCGLVLNHQEDNIKISESNFSELKKGMHTLGTSAVLNKDL